jgi:agmatinase
VDTLDELATLLRPAGGGLYLVSTGRAEQLDLQKRLYGVHTDDAVRAAFRDALERVKDARAFVLGVPSDVGAGFLRGANLGPQAMRLHALARAPDWGARLQDAGVVDVGDVFVVPQLLHDDMLTEAQRAASRAAVYPDVDEAVRATLPVSPLSIAERAIELLFELNPRIAPVLLGGDHSTAWPVVRPLDHVREDRWGIVQSDAHTDLLSERMGVKYCFATWSFHANEVLGREGRLTQVGIRASGHDRSHWEDGLDVRQFWADECRRDPAGALDAILQHLSDAGVESVYFSNDIDGTDERWADATGTPEADGLEPDFVVELIRRLGQEVGLIGADVMEVAPMIRRRVDSTERTLDTALLYLRESLGAITGERL